MNEFTPPPEVRRATFDLYPNETSLIAFYWACGCITHGRAKSMKRAFKLALKRHKCKERN